MSRLLPAVDMELGWRIRSLLEKSKSLLSNMTGMVCRALIYFKQNKEIRISQADKGNYTVELNDSTQKMKILSLIVSRVYELLNKDSTSQIERKVQKHKSTPT
jgi:hypothetical protein